MKDNKTLNQKVKDLIQEAKFNYQNELEKIDDKIKDIEQFHFIKQQKKLKHELFK